MKWTKYTLHTTTEAEDLVSAMLCDLGAEGVQIEDNVPLSEADTKGMFIDILPETGPDDGKSRVSFFLHMAEEDPRPKTKCAAPGEEENKKAGVPGSRFVEKNEQKETEGIEKEGTGSGVVSAKKDASYTIDDRIWTRAEAEKLLSDIREELASMSAFVNIGEGTITVSETEDEDWLNAWKQYFKPFLVDNLLIKPTWEEVPQAYRKGVRDGSLTLIEMDPGTAFGTGSHETTQLCMRMLKKVVQGGEQVLDIGTGSGILGITALKLGAASVTATDLDDGCREAVAENCRANGIPADRFCLRIGNVLGDEETERAVGFDRYEIAVANILAPVIVMLASPGAADRFVKHGGILITSGIIDSKEEDVKKAFQHNPAWEILEVNRQGEWVSVTVRRQ